MMLSCCDKSRSATPLDDFIYNFETISIHQFQRIQSTIVLPAPYFHATFLVMFSNLTHVQLSRFTLYRINEYRVATVYLQEFAYHFYPPLSFTPGPLVNSTGLFHMPFFWHVLEDQRSYLALYFDSRAYLSLVRLVYKNSYSPSVPLSFPWFLVYIMYI